MVISYGNDTDRGLIDDVTPRYEAAAFDVRQPRVQHTAIGVLHAEYLRVQSFAPQSRPEPLDDELLDVPLAASQRQATVYTRVPPLASLSIAGITAASGGITQSLSRAGQATLHAFAAAGLYLVKLPARAVQLGRPHTIYQHNKGVHHVWMVHSVTRRVLVSLVVIAGALGLLTLTQNPSASPAPQAAPSTVTPTQPANQSITATPTSTAVPGRPAAATNEISHPTTVGSTPQSTAPASTMPPTASPQPDSPTPSSASSPSLVNLTQQTINNLQSATDTLLAPALPAF